MKYSIAGALQLNFKKMLFEKSTWTCLMRCGDAVRRTALGDVLVQHGHWWRKWRTHENQPILGLIHLRNWPYWLQKAKYLWKQKTAQARLCENERSWLCVCAFLSAHACVSIPYHVQLLNRICTDCRLSRLSGLMMLHSAQVDSL